MKKYWLLISMLVASLIISACGAASGTNTQIETAAQSVGVADPSAQTGAAEFNSSTSLKLALGTLKLEGSPDEVTAEEAAALLPLWKAVRSLGSSETVAAEEIEALYDQIQETMTPEQVAAMDQMEFTQESMVDIAEDLGIELFANGGRFGDMTPEQQATAQAARESGEFPQGGLPGGGLGGGPGAGGGFGGEFQGGGNLTPELQATMTARREANGDRVNIGVPAALLDALIQYLEGKTG